MPDFIKASLLISGHSLKYRDFLQSDLCDKKPESANSAIKISLQFRPDEFSFAIHPSYAPLMVEQELGAVDQRPCEVLRGGEALVGELFGAEVGVGFQLHQSRVFGDWLTHSGEHVFTLRDSGVFRQRSFCGGDGLLFCGERCVGLLEEFEDLSFLRVGAVGLGGVGDQLVGLGQAQGNWQRLCRCADAEAAE